MIFRFPMKDVTINVTEEKRKVSIPLYADEWTEISQHEFTLDVDDVAWFYAREGKYIEVTPYKSFSLDSLELFLNSTVYAAILHQRKILPLHGSCFNYHGKNLMICGEPGAGKSSLTVAFCRAGSSFITDDISPVIFRDDLPHVLPLSDRVKLWDDTLVQLAIEKKGLNKIQEETDKFYLPMGNESASPAELHHIFILSVQEQLHIPEFEELKGAKKLTALRSQIYRQELLQGMPENDLLLFSQLSELSNAVKITSVKRPAGIAISNLKTLLQNYLDA